MNHFNLKQYQKYVFVVDWINRAHQKELDEFESKFIKSARKQVGKLSDKQIKILDRIVKRFFDI